jgi:putative transcriptional regulator
LRIGGGIALTATRDVLEAIAGAGRAPPRRAVMALGYAGWGAGQLEQELKENVWLTCEADEALLFDAEHETKWARALRKIGINPEHLSGEAGRA